MIRKTLTAALLLLSMAIGAQTLSPERTAGTYMAYPVVSADRIDIPEGWAPFYISHYGRHGSRWLPTEERYQWVMRCFDDDSNLTLLGRDVKRRLKKICSNAKGKAGQLTPLGARQHRAIARRMVSNYPEVFAGGAKVTARSSTVPRCRASMLAFCHELPRGMADVATNQADMAYINYESPELKELTSRTRRMANTSTERFMKSLFVTPENVFAQEQTAAQQQEIKLLSELHTIASDMQDIPLNISLWDLFTNEEMLAVHDANNERMVICNGDTAINNGIPARSSINLWRDIERQADTLIANGGHGATLRFGHDTALYRLLTLLRLRLPGSGMEDFLPMAANLQMVFIKENDGDGVMVAFLLNEQPTKLGILSPHPSHPSPIFYPWKDVKDAVASRIHNLEHLQQLCALNTMVGTDYATTATAGLFGKGSEEHGQTLPAVLVPNGQTFWTPQTQPTELKCVAPYYYSDSIFMGIRASHWLVGGCTQDYGSFTVTAYKPHESNRANKPHNTQMPYEPYKNNDGTPFSHRAEVSHPHYYSVTLPQEQLKIELTGLSHAAILRVTPFTDGKVCVALTVNSDEQQGKAAVDRERRLVTAENPVHRIYQGKGEAAGFSGHFVMRYNEDLVDSRVDGERVVLTFNGRRNSPIELQMATSFTDGDGALRNLAAECTDFGTMMQRNTDAWMQRLHTIDVSDTDTALVNRFYGALYRASFLPREMSDADGRYPRFASDYVVEMGENSKRYSDFSMWDTYRALHPLLCIIAPDESAQMMQSIVGMAEEGGWLPIFPCWNSYTAAMIGDHCTSVLADAYVKGIRGFDAEKAYKYMRRNAFDAPATYSEYQNGMGRRALTSYLRYGYIPLEDSVNEAYHKQEQTSRTLEYAYDDFCVAQMAGALINETWKSHLPPLTSHLSPLTSHLSPLTSDYETLMKRSENWRNVINPLTGYADGRHSDGRWEGNTDLVHRKPYITEGATCHYTWYVPQNIPGLIDAMGGRDRFVAKLDSMFSEGRYWHGNEPCHQVAWLYSLAGAPEKTRRQVARILQTEYNDTAGGLSGNDDAGQMSAWQVFACMGFYPVCPGTPQYVLGGAQFDRVTLNQPGGKPFVIRRSLDDSYRLNGEKLAVPVISHEALLGGGELLMP